MIIVVCANPSVDKWVLLDRFNVGAVNRAGRVEAFPGGKGVHVALAASELGEPVALLGVWAGATGRWVREEVVRRGVSIVVGPETGGWTRTCWTLRDAGRETELLEPGPEVEPDVTTKIEAAFEELLPGSKAAVLSGSLPPGVDARVYERLVYAARQAGVPVILDSSGAAFAAGLDAQPTWAKGNSREISEAVAVPDEPRKLLDQLCGQAEGAVVTLGSEGALFGSGGGRLAARGRVETVVSAVGSGDCMTAGMAVALSRGLDLTSLARLSTACAMANCVHGELGILRRQDVETMLTRVRIEEL